MNWVLLWTAEIELTCQCSFKSLQQLYLHATIYMTSVVICYVVHTLAPNKAVTQDN
jgi:hypothetical protein